MAGFDDMYPSSAVSDRWLGIRDFLLSSKRFQRFAAAFPLTRPVARRRAGELFGLCVGFVHSQILVACVRLRLFSQVEEAPQSPAWLASRAAIPLDSMTTLLEAAASLRLLEHRSGGRFGLGPLGAAFLGNPGIAAMVEHHAALYDDLADPVALLRGEVSDRKLARYWPYAGVDEPSRLPRDVVTPYTALMSVSQPMVADMVLGAYSFSRHRCLLDVGGGDGTFLILAAARSPKLQLHLFDLPEVSAIAREKLSAAGLSARATVTGGSFLQDPLPRGADVISLIRVVHDHDDDTIVRLFRRAREALSPSGVLVIAEPMSSASATDAVSAYFSMYLHAMGSGRPRSFAALQNLLKSAGFDVVQSRKTRIPMIAACITARCVNFD